MKCKKIALKNKKRVVQERGVKNIEGTESEEGTRESKGREPFGRFKGSGGKRNPPAAFLWDRKPVSFVRTKEMGLHKLAFGQSKNKLSLIVSFPHGAPPESPAIPFAVPGSPQYPL